jgi:hypothetical protein
MTKVIPIHGGVAPGTPFGEPVPEVISLLESILERAKAGKVRAVAIAATLEDGDPQPSLTTAWHYEPRYFPDLYTGVSCLLRRLERNFDLD